MKKLVLAMVAGLAVMQAAAAELDWMTDLSKAKGKAKQENKVIMLDFTGSDWCGWCIKLNKEVFSTPEFADYAKKNLVLMEVDFPKKKQLPADLKKANQQLQEKYEIEGYPTIVLLNADGKELGKTGYIPGGPKPFIAQLEKLRK